jgi:hypothetical protein
MNFGFGLLLAIVVSTCDAVRVQDLLTRIAGVQLARKARTQVSSDHPQSTPVPVHVDSLPRVQLTDREFKMLMDQAFTN